jgi:hypothetical protein
MSDHDRDREPLRDREHIHETERTNTTVVSTDGGRRGGGGWLIAILVLIALLALLWFLFGDRMNRAADEVGVNVNVEAPQIDVPDKIEVDVPEELKVETEGNSAR